MANISFNPGVTTNASGSFNTTSEGYMQGTTLDDPSARFALNQGILAAAETLPMWGGVGISEIVPPGESAHIPMSGFLTNLGGVLSRATNVTAPSAEQTAAGTLTGFSVFNQAAAMINTPQSPVPLAGSGMSVNFFRLGSGARIAVAIDPELVDAQGYLISSLVSWDFAQQRLIEYNAAYAANAITAASWASSGGGKITWTTNSNHGVAVGADFTISGMTPAGYNGTFTAIAGTATNSLVAQVAVDPGSETVLGTLVAGGGAVAVRVLDVQIGNSMTVSYDTTTGFATWNRSGSAAVILI